MNKNAGSALLTMLMVTSLVSILMLSYWQQASLLFDLVHERERYRVRQDKVINFFNAATQFVHKHYDQLFSLASPQNPLSFDLEQQLSLEKTFIQGFLTVYKDDIAQCLRIQVRLLEDKQLTLGIQSLVKRGIIEQKIALEISHASFC